MKKIYQKPFIELVHTMTESLLDSASQGRFTSGNGPTGKVIDDSEEDSSDEGSLSKGWTTVGSWDSWD